MIHYRKDVRSKFLQEVLQEIHDSNYGLIDICFSTRRPDEEDYFTVFYDDSLTSPFGSNPEVVYGIHDENLDVTIDDINTNGDKIYKVINTFFSRASEKQFFVIIYAQTLNVPDFVESSLPKEPLIAAGAAGDYFCGDKTFQTLDTSVVPENGNLYYTDARVKALFSVGFERHVNETTGSDITGNGTLISPFQTIQAALNSIGSATTSAEFNNDEINRYVICVAPGTYTENLLVPNRKNITFKLNNALIIGNVVQEMSASLLSGSTQVKLVFASDDLRSTFDGAGVAEVGIRGKIHIKPTGGVSTMIPVVQLINCGVSGVVETATLKPAIDFDSYLSGYFGQVLVDNGYILGDVVTRSHVSGIAAALVYADTDYQASRSAGGTNGNVALFNLRNVKFTRAVVTNSTTGGRWFNVQFNSALSHNFTGFGGTIETDAVSYASYLANVSTKGGGTFTLLDNANSMRYTPAVAANWTNPQPATIQAAIDRMASLIKTLNGGLSIP